MNIKEAKEASPGRYSRRDFLRLIPLLIAGLTTASSRRAEAPPLTAEAPTPTTRGRPWEIPGEEIRAWEKGEAKKTLERLKTNSLDDREFLSFLFDRSVFSGIGETTPLAQEGTNSFKSQARFINEETPGLTIGIIKIKREKENSFPSTAMETEKGDYPLVVLPTPLLELIWGWQWRHPLTADKKLSERLNEGVKEYFNLWKLSQAEYKVVEDQILKRVELIIPIKPERVSFQYMPGTYFRGPRVTVDHFLSIPAVSSYPTFHENRENQSLIVSLRAEQGNFHFFLPPGEISEAEENYLRKHEQAILKQPFQLKFVGPYPGGKYVFAAREYAAFSGYSFTETEPITVNKKRVYPTHEVPALIAFAPKNKN